MRAKLLYATPVNVAYFSAKTCYSSKSAITMSEEDANTEEEKIKFLVKVLKSGHFSVAEGLNYTFALEGVSRSLMAQLTRHRQGIQFSVQSQRYVTYNHNNYSIVTPAPIKNNEEALKVYEDIMKGTFTAYEKLLELGILAEDARYVLPNATCTNITTTINLRELVHICSLRLCTRASLEIRLLMKEMVKEVVKEQPWLEEFLQPKCVLQGYCDERESCGRMPKKD